MPESHDNAFRYEIVVWIEVRGVIATVSPRHVTDQKLHLGMKLLCGIKYYAG